MIQVVVPIVMFLALAILIGLAISNKINRQQRKKAQEQEDFKTYIKKVSDQYREYFHSKGIPLDIKDDRSNRIVIKTGRMPSGAYLLIQPSFAGYKVSIENHEISKSETVIHHILSDVLTPYWIKGGGNIIQTTISKSFLLNELESIGPEHWHNKLLRYEEIWNDLKQTRAQAIEIQNRYDEGMAEIVNETKLVCNNKAQPA
ncbi:hypothetical protein KW791_02345 [Candidatus Parcubacteria bacterium]|nr:hypothetical protein [Candidatus Parcubacteria bacterium]